jgi:hypothetical protein
MSNFNVDTVSDKAGTGPATLTGQEAAKVVYAYDQTSTIAAEEDFNISSYTDVLTGRADCNFTNNMNGSTYAVAAAGTYANNAFATVTLRTTAKVQSDHRDSALVDGKAAGIALGVLA